MKNKKQILSNPRLYVPQWFNTGNNATNKDGIHFNTLWLDYCEMRSTINDVEFQGVSEKNMQKAFSEHLINMPRKRMNDLANSLKCERENLSHLRNWVEIVSGTTNDQDLQVLAHWCWSVKRKALDLKVIHHIMPIFVGKQGSGKTEALKLLTQPWAVCRLETSVDYLAESSNYQSMAGNAVVLFDELEGVQRVDMNTLKRQITTDENSYRPLYQQNTVKVPQRCSFIAASNKHINESIFDATGMRRFYQIVAPKKTTWDDINAIDYTALWQGIDENRTSGYLTGEMLLAVHTTQQEYVIEDDIDAFIRINELTVEGKESKEVEARELFANYVQWAKTSNVKYPLSMIMFNKKLSNRGIETHERRLGTSRIRHFKINLNSPVLGLPPKLEAVISPFDLAKQQWVK